MSGEYAEFEIDNTYFYDNEEYTENEEYDVLACDYDNVDISSKHKKLISEVEQKYNINIPCLTENSFIYSVLVFYQTKGFISKKQLDKCVELDEINYIK